jgi:Do/DeqQ family serine protease
MRSGGACLIRLALAVVFALFAAPAFAETIQRAAPQGPAQVRLSFAPVVKKATPAVVNVYASRVETMPHNPLFDDPIFRRFFGGEGSQDQRVQKALGSGVIVDPSGLVVTNHHVIEGMTEVKVALSDKREFEAQIVLRDPCSDLAVLKLKGGGNFPVLEIGDSDALEVGDFVIAIGDPFGVGQTVTQGIVSALARTQTGISDLGFFIQTDAAINPGNSGGPLLNSRGEVIGINSMIATGGSNQSAGIGFAIPINTAKAVISDLITIGRVRRPSLGIRTLPIGPELAQEMGLPSDYGILIVQTMPGGSAERAGLRGGNQRAYLGNVPVMLGGDLIVAIDGEEIGDQQDLSNLMNKHKAGDTITVSIFRGKKKMDVKVTLSEAREQA